MSPQLHILHQCTVAEFSNSNTLHTFLSQKAIYLSCLAFAVGIQAEMEI